MNLNTNSNHEPNNNKSQEVEEFCLQLLSQMTLEEKVGQMFQADLGWKHDIKQWVREGKIGSLLSIRDAHTVNEYQQIAVEETRLHIPLLVGNDIIHGYRCIFPIPLALSCTWDPDLIEKIASITLAEAMAAGTTWNYSPMVDISRDPRWGRIAESAGEDPVLGSRISKAWVRGYQNYQDPSGKKTASCVKHYAAYGASESGKDYNSVDMSERRLREEYLPPYHAAVKAGVKTLMTSFNDLNGIPATANSFLLRKILREEWGFKGVVVSDFDAIGELIHHGFAKDHKEAALRSILAGVDIDMMGNAYPFHLADLVNEGKVPIVLVDEAVLRILSLKVELGLFEHPFIDEKQVESFLMQPETQELAAQTAAKSIVLLKNEDNLLPLKAAGKTVALIGPMAHERKSLLGCWSFDGHPEDVETLAEVFSRDLPEDANLIVEPGCLINGQECDFSAAITAAQKADVVLLALGEDEMMSGEAHSRAHLNLPGRQSDLVKAIISTGKPIIMLIMAGRPLVLTDLIKKVSSVVMAWHGGTFAAQGICDILFGKVNPSGKLTAGFPRCEGQIPNNYAHKSTGRPVDSRGTIQFNQAHRSAYLDESNDPLFPFGFGLSYTKFDYSDLCISTPKLELNETLEVSALITNIGNMVGEEIVQFYVRDLVGSVTRPVKELKDFCKITLQPGETRRVIFKLQPEQLSFLDVNLKSVIEPGEFKIWIGPNSVEGLEGRFDLV